MSGLYHFLKRFDYLKEEVILDFVSLCKEETHAAGEYLLKASNVCKEVFFLEEGIVRSFYTTESGEDNTYCITFPGTFLTAYTSFITQCPSIENLQAITDVSLYTIDKAEVERLGQETHHWMRFQKEMAEMQYMELEQRVHQLQNVPAKDRFDKLFTEHPEYVLHIPVQYLSSYLGVSARHFSRIRKEIIV